MPFFSKKKSFLSALIITGCLMSANVSALQVGNMWFIGDSLSDQGNCNLPGRISPVTNGNTFAFHLGNKFDKYITPSKLGGTDFACVGASTGFTSGLSIVFGIKNGIDQINELLNTKPTFGSHDLFFYWMGANDILLSEPIETVPFYPPFNATTSVNFVQLGLNRLHAAGAKYMVVINLPALEKTPAGMDPTNTPAQNAAYFNSPREFNRELLARLNNLGFNVIQIDLFSIFNALIANPQPFGITNTTVGCTQPGGQSCDTSFFFDDVHPTDKVHRMLADAIFSILTAPDFYATLAQVPFSLLEAENTTIRQQLYPQQPAREIGKIYPFVGGDVNFFNSQPAISSDRMTFKSNSGAATVGIVSQINEEVLLGAAVGQAVNRMNYDNFDSGFRLNATILSLFGSYQKEKFYVNGVLNYAQLHYYDIERQFNIGPVLFSSDGDTSGNQAGASFETGYNFINRDDLQIGPIATLSYQYLNVNGYTETGGDVFDLVFDDQKNSSLVGGLGLQATYKKLVNSIPITTNIFATLNRQFSGGEREIFFHQASIAANFASLPVLEPKYSYASGGINIAAELKHGITASIGYFATVGEYGSHSNLIAVGLTAAL